ncbi:hypothetical protein BOX15_Mlig016695g2 [Macrostomum lignano]|uniref:ULP_PROTEASE domain-containing protein n=2 Tax=Macrostomum lignano TaxID=282301 RepID=A0A1I8GD96_9PLAT|nr:hypothetical protein BOX15_Mlig016695g2 [Macrostomum lignano]
MLRKHCSGSKQQPPRQQLLSLKKIPNRNRKRSALKKQKRPARLVATTYLDLERPKSICTKSFRQALLQAIGSSDSINNNSNYANNNSSARGYYRQLVVYCERCGSLGVELATCNLCGRYLPMPAVATKSDNKAGMISATTAKRKSATPAVAAASSSSSVVAAAASSSASASVHPASSSPTKSPIVAAAQHRQSQRPSGQLGAVPPSCLQTGAALSADIQRFLASRSASIRVSASSVAASSLNNRLPAPASAAVAVAKTSVPRVASVQRQLVSVGGKINLQKKSDAAASAAAKSLPAFNKPVTSSGFCSKRPRLEAPATLPASQSRLPLPTPAAPPAARPSMSSSSNQSLLGSPVVEMPLDQVCIGNSAFQKVDPPHNLLKVYHGFTQFSFPRSNNCAKARRRRRRRRRQQRGFDDDDFEDEDDDDFADDVIDSEEEDNDYDDMADDDDDDDEEEEAEVEYAQIHLHHAQISKVSFAIEPTCFVAFRLKSAEFSRRICSEAGLQPGTLSAAETRDLGKKWIVLVSDNEREGELRKLFAFYTDKKAESQAKFDFDLQNLNKVSARGMLDHCQQGFFNELLGLPQQQASAPAMSSTLQRLHSSSSTAGAAISCSSNASSASAVATSASSAAKSAELYQKVANSNLAIGLLVQQKHKQQNSSVGNGTASQQIDASAIEPSSLQSESSQEQRQLSTATSASAPTSSGAADTTTSSSNSKPPPRLTGQVIEKFSYSPGGTNGITITNADLMCLNPCEYLNDVAIDFYLKYMYHEMLTPEQRKSTHIFNCFFFKRLSQKLDPPPGKDESAASLAIRRHETVAKWTRKVDLFTKDFILIPINENCHWFLAVICFPWMVGMVNYTGSAEAQVNSLLPFDVRMASDGTLRMPCVLMFDSLMGSTRSPNVLAIREYLQVEWDIKKRSMKGPKVFDKETIRGYCPCVPLQPNTVDCGPYVLHYAELFFKRPVREFTRNYFQLEMSSWFRQEEINHKRAEIQDLIVSLARKNNALGPDAAAALAAAAGNSDGSSVGGSASSSFCA